MNDFEAGTSGPAMEEFDVFLNHRGPDVKATFVAHLEDALQFAGFRPFLDVKSLRKSNPALRSMDQALAMAKVHIAVVSRGYAESKYCLNELVAMLKSKKPVIPVFYGVEPVDLRWVENGPFAEAFDRHKVRGRSERKVQEWRDALGALAGLTGFRLSDYKSDEARLKRDVVNEVARLTPSNQAVEVGEFRVGLEGPTNACIKLLGDMGDGVGLLGLVGMGGVGKTTLAREIYNHYAGTSDFKFMTFLEIHRNSLTLDVEVRPRRCGNLQEQMLWDMLRIQDNGSSNGIQFRRVSMLGPVFIVIDDVHSLGQFQELVPSFEVLCPGSRIIITSRDRSVVNNFTDRANGHYIYQVPKMGFEDANMLFNLHAFHSKDAPEDYNDIAKSVVEACGGLPLALKVIGSSLFEKRLGEDREAIWVEAIDALRQSEDVMGVLRWSYERLSESEKLMFLDITCLFNDHRVEEAFAYWESCKLSRAYVGLCAPHTSYRNLINKNLVGEKGWGVFEVHGLLQELGQTIAMNAKRHLINDGFLVDLDKVETIGLNLVGCRKRKFKSKDFENLCNLHSLRLPDGCKVYGGIGSALKKLRLLQWRSMPLKSLPEGLSQSLLIVLDLSESKNLASIWTESNGSAQSFPNLHSLNLKGCTSIKRLPDSLGQSFQLKYLNLDRCEKLKKLPNFIGELKALKELTLDDCKNLKTLPDTIAYPHLIRLSLDGCTSVTKLPDTIACPHLDMFILSKCTSITELPKFLGQYSRLYILNLQGCINLKTIPESIGQLQALRYLYIDGCRSLKALPDSFGALSKLKHFNSFNCTSLVKIPSSVKLLSSLQDLQLGPDFEKSTFRDVQVYEGQSLGQHLESSSQVGSFLKGGALRVLTILEICDNALIELPESIGLLAHLRTLNMRSCVRLERLPDSIGDLKLLIRLELTNCHNLRRLPKNLGALARMKCLIIRRCWAITKLPRSIGLLSQLEYLQLEQCTNLKRLPTSVGQLRSLWYIHIEDCGSIEAMEALKILQGVPIWGTTSITKLPPSLSHVSYLVVHDCFNGFNGRRSHHEYLGGGLFWTLYFSGSYEVLEEDESGVLRGYHGDGTSQSPSLLRFQPRREA